MRLTPPPAWRAPACRSRAKSKRAIGYTMFGVTTTCIERDRASAWKAGLESFVFHATGTGGQSYRELAESGFFDGVFDITTTEVAD